MCIGVKCGYIKVFLLCSRSLVIHFHDLVEYYVGVDHGDANVIVGCCVFVQIPF